MRAWNVKHPSRYARMLAEGTLPRQESEQLGESERELERVMLGLRIVDGLRLADVPERNRDQVGVHLDRGHLEPDAAADGRLVLTLPGRLLADAVIRDLVI